MKVKRDCPVCGVTYEAESTRLKFGRQTTCSRDCSYRLRAMDKEKQVQCVCGVCGEQFNKAPSQIKGKHGFDFCSRSCHYAGRSAGLSLRIVTKPYNISEEARAGWREGAKKTRETRMARDNYRHTEATRIKLSEQTAKAIADGRVPARSKLEDKVAVVLDDLGVEYIRQFPIRNANGTFSCVFDFFLVGGIALEVNGTFWHSDPRFFPNGPVHKVQKRNAIKWTGKLAQAASRNIRVVEVWEYDINKDATKAVSEALGLTITS